MIGPLVYILCALTSLGCTLLLWRSYRRTHTRLLFWSALCFAIMALSNIFLVFDLLIFPDVYLLPFRSMVSLAAYLVLIVGLVFESN
jgi:hypothetical protein